LVGLLGYLWQRTARRLHLKWELAAALGVTAAIVCAASLGARDGMDRFVRMSLREIAERGEKSADQVVAVLKEDGLVVRDPADSLIEIARYNNASPGAVIAAVQRHVPKLSGPPAHH
jgi:hypothetical protein